MRSYLRRKSSQASGQGSTSSQASEQGSEAPSGRKSSFSISRKHSQSTVKANEQLALEAESKNPLSEEELASLKSHELVESCVPLTAKQVDYFLSKTADGVFEHPSVRVEKKRGEDAKYTLLEYRNVTKCAPDIRKRLTKDGWKPPKHILIGEDFFHFSLVPRLMSDFIRKAGATHSGFNRSSKEEESSSYAAGMFAKVETGFASLTTEASGSKEHYKGTASASGQEAQYSSKKQLPNFESFPLIEAVFCRPGLDGVLDKFAIRKQEVDIVIYERLRNMENLPDRNSHTPTMKATMYSMDRGGAGKSGRASVGVAGIAASKSESSSTEESMTFTIHWCDPVDMCEEASEWDLVNYMARDPNDPFRVVRSALTLVKEEKKKPRASERASFPFLGVVQVFDPAEYDYLTRMAKYLKVIEGKIDVKLVGPRSAGKTSLKLLMFQVLRCMRQGEEYDGKPDSDTLQVRALSVNPSETVGTAKDEVVHDTTVFPQVDVDANRMLNMCDAEGGTNLDSEEHAAKFKGTASVSTLVAPIGTFAEQGSSGELEVLPRQEILANIQRSANVDLKKAADFLNKIDIILLTHLDTVTGDTLQAQLTGDEETYRNAVAAGLERIAKSGEDREKIQEIVRGVQGKIDEIQREHGPPPRYPAVGIKVLPMTLPLQYLDGNELINPMQGHNEYNDLTKKLVLEYLGCLFSRLKYLWTPPEREA